jgi:acetyl esterase/lipase
VTDNQSAPIGPAVPFDPELAAALAMIQEHVPKFESLEAIPAARAAETAGMEAVTVESLSRDGTFEVTERSVPGPQDAPDVKLLILRPSNASGATPVFYHTHGGGMIIGDYKVIADEYLDWATRFGVTIISVEYRLAPETQHPGLVEDCYAGLVWTAENAAELNIDPARIVIVGASAGGGLAAATALLARDRGGPALAAQLLKCPMLDDRNDTPSAIQGEGRGIWDRRANQTGWTALLGDARGTTDVSPYAAPARATDLSNLPPTFIDVGSAETFRDEAVAYASGIWRAGGIAELHVFAGGFHGYDSLAPHAAVSKHTQEARLAWLTRFFEG